MNLKTLILPTVALAALSACTSVRRIEPIDNALLVDVSIIARAQISDARASRDAAEDAYALARTERERAEQEVELAGAALETVRSQLKESELILRFTEKNGTADELAQARAAKAYALARVEYSEELIVVRERELDMAEAQEKFKLEERRLADAEIELAKAEALERVDRVAAQQIEVGEYREHVTYFRWRVEAERGHVKAAESELVSARNSLQRKRVNLQSLQP